jgi:hypothetical protein
MMDSDDGMSFNGRAAEAHRERACDGLGRGGRSGWSRCLFIGQGTSEVMGWQGRGTTAGGVEFECYGFDSKMKGR